MECFISDAPVAPLGLRAVGDALENIRDAFIPGRPGNIPASSSYSPIEAWEYLNKVWNARNLIVVVSSLQVYRNMILTSLTAPKTARIGKALQFRASLRQMRILESATVRFPAFKVAPSKAVQTRAQTKKKTGLAGAVQILERDAQKLKGQSLLFTIFENLTAGD